MPAYKYYAWERDEFRDLYNIPLDSCEISRIHKRLSKHYGFDTNIKGISKVKLTTTSRFGTERGEAYYSISMIKLGTKTTLGVLVHEWAHIVNGKSGGRHHDRLFKRWHKKIATYVRKRKYFGLIDKMILDQRGAK